MALQFIPGPGDQENDAQAFTKNLLIGMQLPAQLQAQQLHNQVMANQLDFQQKQQPLMLQQLKQNIDQQAQMGPEQIKALQANSAAAQALAQHYGAASKHMEAQDTAEIERLRQSGQLNDAQISHMKFASGIAAAQVAMQLTTSNLNNEVIRRQLPSVAEQARADVQAKLAQVQQSQAQSFALTAGVLQNQQAFNAQQHQLAQQTWLQAAQQVGNENIPMELRRSLAEKFNIPMPAGDFQPQTIPQAVNRVGAAAIMNAPDSVQSQIVARSAGLETPASINSNQMMGGGPTSVESGLRTGIEESKAKANIARTAPAYLAGQSAVRAAGGTPQSQQAQTTTTPTSTGDPFVDRIEYHNTQRAGVIDQTMNQTLTPKAQKALQENPARKLLDQIDDHDAPPFPDSEIKTPYGTIQGSDLDAFKKAADFTDKSSQKITIKDPKTGQPVQLEDGPATVAQEIRYKAAVGEMYKRLSEGKDPNTVLSAFNKVPGAFTLKQMQQLNRLVTEIKS